MAVEELNENWKSRGMKYPYRNVRVATRTIEGEAVAVSPDDSTLHSFNRVGTLIWEMADGQTSIEAIVDGVISRFEVDREQALADVDAFCGELVEKEILFLSDEPLEGRVR